MLFYSSQRVFPWACILWLQLFIASNWAFSITAPSPGSLIAQNAQVLVRWQDPPANTSTVTVQIGQGPSASAFLTIGTLAQNEPASSGSVAVSIPSTIATGSNYYIRVVTNAKIDTIGGPITIFDGSSSVMSITTSSPATIISSASFMPSSVSSATTSSVTMISSSLVSSSTISSSVSGSISASETSNSHGTTPTSNSNPSNSNSDSSLGTPEIAGIAIGAVGGIGLAIAACFCIRRAMREDEAHEEAASEIFHTYGKSTGVVAATGGAAGGVATVSAMHRNHRHSASPAPRPPPHPAPESTQEQGAGRYYDTGYNQYFQYDSNAAYGYHPAAVYSPALAPASQLYQASYHPNNPYFEQPQQPSSAWPEQGYYFNEAHSPHAHDANYYQPPGSSSSPMPHHDGGHPTNFRQ